MNRTKIKNYAPQARRDFIQAVTDRAAFYGLTAKKTERITENGDVAIIGGRAFPHAIVSKRNALEQRIKRQGLEQTMEALAYTWFNRLVAIRYMELHGYLDHGYRVLSARKETTDHTDGTETKTSSGSFVKSVVQMPEILEHAEHVDLPGLDKTKVIELKLDGAKEAELYRMLLLAQCNALYSAMPFLFERVNDETELLLPDNLLHSDSIIRKLVSEIDGEDWQEVEIIGWLYQFYISEKKDQVIGSVVKSEDIPAATQLFTPNWIVKYLVQNSLGRQWVATYPHSPLKQQMAFYIEPAEQTPEVREQLRTITPETLNPEEITFLDPACGSGHILVEAYDLFKAIYQERGYRAKDIPRLILSQNLFGLEIDDRAAQLAAFALLMKARADDRQLFKASGRGHSPGSTVQPHVMALVETKDMNAGDIAAALSGQWAAGSREEPPPPPGHLFEPEDNLFTRAATKFVPANKPLTTDDGQLTTDIRQLIDLFAEARTFGSLIQVPPALAARLPLLEQRVNEAAAAKGDLSSQVAMRFQPVVEQSRLLARQHDCVVANPPYMGAKFFPTALKTFVGEHYKDSKADAYACFIQRNAIFSKPNAFFGMITIPNWMFLSSFEDLRKSLFGHQTIDTFIHNGRGVFGSDFGSCSFVYRNASLPTYRGTFRRLFDKQGSVASNEELEQRFGTAKDYTPSNADFAKIPGSPVAYWVSDRMRDAFAINSPINAIAAVKQGMSSADNPRFTREWWEVPHDQIGFAIESREAARISKRKWFPYNNGGPFRKWYGNLETLIDWQNDGCRIRQHPGAAIRNPEFFFRKGVTWTDISSSCFGVRLLEKGAVFANTGSCCFASNPKFLLGYLASPVAFAAVRILNPSLHTEIGDVSRLPILSEQTPIREQVENIADKAIGIARLDWDSFETSWDFQTLPVLQHKAATLQLSQAAADAEALARFQRMKQLEEENNRLFIDAYGLQDELSPEVPDDQITLYRPAREEDVKRLISYAIGCMMGRYSLDRPGLIYAGGEGSGVGGQRSGKTERFPADTDGIVPLMEADWFADDAANRFVEFISVAWPGNSTPDCTDNTDKTEKNNPSSSVLSVVKSSSVLEENLKFAAESLGPTKGEQPRDTIRRYLATGFFKHHLQIYKRRPIYWLFSSGKLRAFQCLVYLHRYHESTLSRMRTKYVIALQGKLASRIDQLAGDIQKATSTSHRRKLEKERDSLLKQQAELFAFDEKLRHYADLRISLDLDDGVKVNYGKFGDLLAEVKAVTGSKEEE